MNVTQILITAGGSIIIILLGIVGFFLRQHIEVVKELTKSVNILSKLVAILENNAKNMILGYNQKHSVIDTRLTTHGKRIDSIDIEIAEIRTELKHKQDK